MGKWIHGIFAVRLSPVALLYVENTTALKSTSCSLSPVTSMSMCQKLLACFMEYSFLDFLSSFSWHSGLKGFSSMILRVISRTGSNPMGRSTVWCGLHRFL